ncbi:endolytic transglycosylase MltG [Patescibacteria group bacterium]|nr:endolytic transglycosylase MltG [Patescibacteria group bacterium]
MRTKIVFGLFMLIFAAGAFGLVRIEQQRRVEISSRKAPNVVWRAVEGWTAGDIEKDLAAKGLVNSADFEAQLKASAQSFDYLGDTPKVRSLEGYLFPDTYFLAVHPTAESVINKMLDNFKAKVTPQLQSQIKARGFTIYQAVTLASIVEKEVGRRSANLSAADLQTLQNEREIVAGIFINRLNIGMPLQSDATVTYITKKNNPQATAEDLQIDSPYNTYKYKGLPPGPISNPSLSSIEAVANYKQTDYLYFLTKPDGTAVFAKTLDEQNANKAKYLGR